MNRRTGNSASLSAMTIMALSVALLLISVMPAMAYDHGQTYDANATYFVQEDIRVSGDGDYQNVEIWINTSVAVTNGKIQFSYDPNCADVTSVTKDPLVWPQGAVNYGTPGLVIITFGCDLPGYSGPTKVASMTIECNSTSDCCGTLLAHDPSAYLTGISNVNWANGTFVCGEPLVVDKTVWDESISSWVDPLTLTSSWMGEDVRFNVTVTAGCLNLSNVVVSDTMDAGLLFNDTPSPPWTVGTLAAGASTSIYFNATIDGYGPQDNTATANATVDDLAGLGVQASDTATVDTCPPAGFGVNKTVWNGSAWVELVSGAEIGETYRFRVEVENTGSPTMDICNITVTDILPANLAYAGNALLQDHHDVWWGIEPPDFMLGWHIDNWVPIPLCIQPGQKIVIEYDATVTNYGPGTNNVTAEGYCAVAGQWVQESDNASVDASGPDLIVSDIKVNYDASAMENLAIGPRAPGTRTQCNNISVNITEQNGVDVESDFDVTLEINGVAQACSPMTVSAVMAGGSTVTLYCDCSFRPIADVLYNISATADSGGVIIESDETNNTGWRNLTAITNGYKGNGWQDGRNISALQCHEQGPINLTYSPGDSYYESGYYNFWGTYEVNWVPTDLNIPSTGTSIKKARLYAYYHGDKTGTKGENLSLNFNTHDIPVDEHYSDGKGFGAWDYSSYYGVLVYNVTDEFAVGPNTAILTDTNIPGVGKGNNLTMEGMVLVVVYENPDEPDRIIWLNEGCDLLKMSSIYGVSAEEATTYAAFEECEPIPLELVQKATLVSITQCGNQGGDLNRLYFNGGEWHGLFPGGYVTGTNIGIHEANVKPYLEAEDNVATYQDNGDMFAAANSFLIVEKGDYSMYVDPSETVVQPQDQFWVNITLDAGLQDVYAYEYKLKYNTSVLYAEAQVEGDFLSSAGSTSVVHFVNDHTNGVLELGVTLVGNDTCKHGGSGTVARIHFHATGSPGQVTDLDLYDVLIVDGLKNNVEIVGGDGTVEIWKNKAPVSIGTTKHRYSNAAEKYTCYADLCACQSYDPDNSTGVEYGDEIVYTMWHFGDGSSGTSEGAFDENCQKLHMYSSWNWTSTGEEEGYYTPFLAGLTLTDDGDPQLSNTSWFDVMVYIGGDANGDGKVNVVDAAYVGKHWEQTTSMPEVECCPYWEVEQADKADLNNDLAVNLFDMAIVGANWGHTAWP